MLNRILSSAAFYEDCLGKCRRRHVQKSQVDNGLKEPPAVVSATSLDWDKEKVVTRLVHASTCGVHYALI